MRVIPVASPSSSLLPEHAEWTATVSPTIIKRAFIIFVLIVL